MLNRLISLTFRASSDLERTEIRFIADHKRYVCPSTRQRSMSSCKDTMKLLQQETQDVIGPVFPASRVQHISDLHSKFALRPHKVPKYGRHPVCGC